MANAGPVTDGLPYAPARAARTSEMVHYCPWRSCSLQVGYPALCCLPEVRDTRFTSGQVPDLLPSAAMGRARRRTGGVGRDAHAVIDQAKAAGGYVVRRWHR